MSEFLERIIKKRKVIIFDDAGAAINARRWREDLNQLVADTSQTVRFLNQVIIFTMPSLGFLDKQVRGLLHFAIFKKSVDTAYVYRVLNDRLRGMVYFKRIGHIHPIPLPSQELIDVYEAKKQTFMMQRYKEALKTARELEKTKLSDDEMIQILQDNMDLILDKKGRINTAKIAGLLKCSYQKALILKKRLELIQKEVVL